jgi:hypothetical protein
MLRTDVRLVSQPLSYGKSIRHCKTAPRGVSSGGSLYEKQWFIGISSRWQEIYQEMYSDRSGGS